MIIKYSKFLLIFTINIFVFCDIKAQSASEIYLTENYSKEPLFTILSELEDKSHVKFFYKENWIKNIFVSMKLENEVLEDALKKMLVSTNLSAIKYDDYTIVLINKEDLNQQFQKKIKGKYQERNIRFIGKHQLQNQFGEIEVYGTVTDGKNGSPIVDAVILSKNTNSEILTDESGFFKLVLPKGKDLLYCKALGYENEYINVFVQSSGELQIEIFEKSYELDEVTVSAEGEDQNLSALEAGKVNLGIKTIKKLPAFLGEVDVVKSLLILPGVSSSGEGTSGINVRGGTSDQNLVLLDGSPIFNSPHLFGFFSALNSDVVRNVTLFKGAAPAVYGGKISSVMDINLKSGDMTKFKGAGGLGLVASRVSLEGPIKKGKASFLLAGRTSYSDWLIKSIKNADLAKSSASFYDLNGKVDFIVSDKDRLSLNVYTSSDAFQLASDTLFDWSSTSAAIRWSHEFSDKWHSLFKTGYSEYQNNIEGKSPTKEFKMNTAFKTVGFHEILSFNNDRGYELEMGGSLNYNMINPGMLVPGENSVWKEEKLLVKNSLEPALFVQNRLEISPRLALTFGLRYSWFLKFAEAKEYTYASDGPKSPESIVDSLYFDKGTISKIYKGIEPRFSAKYILSGFSSVKFGYNRNQQFFHLISNNTGINPYSFWTSSDKDVPAVIGDQVSLGYYHDFQAKALEASVEIYYKHLQNVVDYKDGAELLMNEHLETDLLSGNGKGYGLELLLKKVSGRLTGWLSYTYSRTFLQMDSQWREEQVNRGSFYPSNIDKPHDFSLVTKYNLTKRWSFSTNFVYASGSPMTYPDATYKLDGYTFSNYSNRNEYRAPSYHRLDVSLTVDGNHKRVKKWDSSWTLAVYNLYARKNAYSVFFMKKKGEPMQAYKLSLLGVPLPSLTYNFKF